MVTRKQHYYPRCLLKYFADDKGKVYVYLPNDNKFTYTKYDNVCHKKDAYESYNNDKSEKPDNILENKLAKYENKLNLIIEKIHNTFNEKVFEENDLYVDDDEFNLTNDDVEFLYRYMYLQYLRTDAGRLNFINRISDIFNYKPRQSPVDVNEIKDNKSKIKLFNKVFKEGNRLENYIDNITKPNSMKLRVLLSLHPLITSDNPIIATDDWKQIILPITPFLCIEFQYEKFMNNNKIFTVLSTGKSQFINKAQINTSNYFVISQGKFKIDTKIHF
ncbi:DUF4238 domain-containing protein [Staphylococcus chromogenes]|uniref:DUF4238 domain-containing protein n=1 Tax=Staphylococcus chromogenes TaxID=46126 RepID=UPI002886A2D2|nr:DUF4238 domain-containing protein [Staphylococcus chromogenes]MDT0700453.1 DUF4238 domain-containing protein [Staphylococcus chromogenes]